ncbi:MAG: ABC transporter ATP-binding protein [Patescibacteria group bacterium]
MNYTLNTQKTNTSGPKPSFLTAMRKLAPLLATEKRNLVIAMIAIIVNSLATLVAPIVVSHTVDTYIRLKNFHGVLLFSGILVGIYLIGLVGGYLQTMIMGGVSRRVLFKLRNSIFTKLQELPVAFFNQNKAGDLISRINNDTDRLNMFFSQGIMQFIGSFFLILGAGIFLLVINIRLGSAALVPALCVLIFTQIISGWVKRRNLRSLQTVGGMSSEIQESLANFKVIVAFNRLDYFREKFHGVNESNFQASVQSGIANNIFTPLYGLASMLAQLIVISYGISLILNGHITIGILIGYLLYVNNFYSPLRQLAAIWASFQLALAAFDRISEVLALESDMPIIIESETEKTRSASSAILRFDHVHFHYPNGVEVLGDINLELLPGKTYALVGPTGGGKTTTASLMARLFDPSEGTVLLSGHDIRTYTPKERTQKIGFILQEPFLFTGTVRDNILYGNTELAGYTSVELLKVLEDANLSKLLARFTEGLDTPVSTSGNSVSLGQKQLIAFMRAVLRKPELLILDEATANIDTVTEELLEEILAKLPATTTKVIIAHRLNTIRNADQIFFINGGQITLAGDMEHAVEMLLHGKRNS